ncbi:hypothetical protein [Pseudomonas congelans]|uniref:hypothetical protein n=1 Tax=Pseudomonas congelans TaxID=200452 RepID=UPI0009B18DE1|nr:hypothetical protein [Pseudomonas congelans]
MTVDDHIEQELQEVAEHLEVYRILIIDDPSLEPLIPIENRLEVIKPPERSPERFVTCGELLSVRPPVVRQPDSTKKSAIHIRSRQLQPSRQSCCQKCLRRALHFHPNKCRRILKLSLNICKLLLTGIV